LQLPRLSAPPASFKTELARTAKVGTSRQWAVATARWSERKAHNFTTQLASSLRASGNKIIGRPWQLARPAASQLQALGSSGFAVFTYGTTSEA
jgi:hypothetical protein